MARSLARIFLYISHIIKPNKPHHISLFIGTKYINFKFYQKQNNTDIILICVSSAGYRTRLLQLNVLKLPLMKMCYFNFALYYLTILSYNSYNPW